MKKLLTGLMTVFMGCVSYEGFASEVQAVQDDLDTKVARAYNFCAEAMFTENETEQYVQMVRDEHLALRNNVSNAAPEAEPAPMNSVIPTSVASNAPAREPAREIEEVVQNNMISLAQGKIDSIFAGQFNTILGKLVGDINTTLRKTSPKFSFAHWLARGDNANKRFDVEQWSHFQKRGFAWDIVDQNLLPGPQQAKIVGTILWSDFFNQHRKDITELSAMAREVIEDKTREELIRSLAPARPMSQADNLANTLGSVAQEIRHGQVSQNSVDQVNQVLKDQGCAQQ